MGNDGRNNGRNNGKNNDNKNDRNNRKKEKYTKSSILTYILLIASMILFGISCALTCQTIHGWWLGITGFISMAVTVFVFFLLWLTDKKRKVMSIYLWAVICVVY